VVRQLLVTCAIIERDGKYLLTQRQKDARNGLRWEFPGGQLEQGESPRDCLVREIEEELGVAIEADDVFDVSSCAYEKLGLHVVLLAFRCRILEGVIVKRCIKDYAWVAPDKMDTYDITEADLPFVEKLLAEHRD